MEVFRLISDIISNDTVVVLVLCMFGATCAYNVVKHIIYALRRPLLRSNNSCLEYFDFQTSLWMPVYGVENIGGYELFHILSCESSERLEFYQNKWNSVRDLKMWIKEQRYENKEI